MSLPYEIGVSQSNYKELEYILYEDGEIINRFTIDKQPKDLSNKSTKLQEFIKTLLTKEDIGITDDEGDFIKYTKEQIQEKIQKTLGLLQASIQSYNQNKDKIEEEREKQKHDAELKEAEEGYTKLCTILEENKVSFIDFVTSLGMWLNGGETVNTIKGFLCHSSTYLGIKPIWFLVLGPAGEGKSIIEESAYTLIPPGAFTNGRMTESALYRKAVTENKNYLDCKIARMGDMGGDSDFEKYEGTIDRFKELTTEGVTKFDVTGDNKDPETGERTVLELEVYGYCSVSMTSVHSEKLKDQLLSRGIDVTPQATNEEVKLYKRYNQGKIKRYYSGTITGYIHLVHQYLTYLKMTHARVEVINPYFDCISNWLEESEYFKRYLDIITLLVQTVTILNYNFRQRLIAEDGTEYVISEPQDNELIANLFNPGFGLTETAKVVLNKLIELYNKTEDGNSPHLTLESYEDLANFEFSDYNNNHGRLDARHTLFSVSTVKHVFSKIKSLKRVEVGEIFKHLVDMGYIVAMGKVYRSNKNVYRLNTITRLESGKLNFDDDIVARYVQDLAPIFDIGPHLLLEKTNIENQYTASPCSIDDLDLPPWVSLSADRVPWGDILGSRVPKKDFQEPQSAEHKEGVKDES